MKKQVAKITFIFILLCIASFSSATIITTEYLAGNFVYGWGNKKSAPVKTSAFDGLLGIDIHAAFGFGLGIGANATLSAGTYRQTINNIGIDGTTFGFSVAPSVAWFINMNKVLVGIQLLPAIYNFNSTSKDETYYIVNNKKTKKAGIQIFSDIRAGGNITIAFGDNIKKSWNGIVVGANWNFLHAHDIEEFYPLNGIQVYIGFRHIDAK